MVKRRTCIVVQTALVVSLLAVGIGRAEAQTTSSQGAAVAVPDDLHQQLTRMRTLAEQQYSDDTFDRSTLYQLFNSAAAAAQRVMRPSVAQRLSATENANSEAKLATILADLRQRPDVYATIENRYVNGAQNPLARVISPPDLLPEHATETYRLAWEYILLRPEFVSNWRVALTAIRALVVIHNPATLTTAVECYRTAAKAPAPITLSQRRQMAIIDLLRTFQDTQAGKDALQQCLHLAEDQRSGITDLVRQRAGGYNADWNASDYARSRGMRFPTTVSEPLGTEQLMNIHDQSSGNQTAPNIGK